MYMCNNHNHNHTHKHNNHNHNSKTVRDCLSVFVVDSQEANKWSGSCGRRKYAALAPAPASTPTVTMAPRDRSKVFMVRVKSAGLGQGDTSGVLLGVVWSGL